MRVGDHKFQGNAKNVLRRALLNHRNLIEIKLYNQLLPKLLGRMLLASNIAHGLTCLGLWRIRFSKESLSSFIRAVCFTKTLSILDFGYLTFSNDWKMSPLANNLGKTEAHHFRFLFQDVDFYELFCFSNSVFYQTKEVDEEASKWR